MAEAKQLYATLGVEKDATQDEIRRAYRKLAKEWHPDVRGGSEAEARFKAITAAFEVLSDPGRRALYDEFGEAALQSGFDPERGRAYQSWGQRAEPWATASSGGFDSSVFDDLFGEEARQSRGSDLHAVVELEFVDALRGTELTARVPVLEECKFCAGARRRQRKRCDVCHGEGFAMSEKSIVVRIPKGTDDGTVLTVKGQGNVSPFGGPAGDLVIEARVRPHPHFERDGLDLRLRLPITVDEAVNGASVQVPTPEGAVKLKIPPRSQNGAVLRLREKGVTRKEKTGDLYVELCVRLPDEPDEEFAAAARRAATRYRKPVREDVRL